MEDLAAAAAAAEGVLGVSAQVVTEAREQAAAMEATMDTLAQARRAWGAYLEVAEETMADLTFLDRNLGVFLFLFFTSRVLIFFC